MVAGRGNEKRVEEKRVRWDEEPARLPLDLSVSIEERVAIESQFQWFSKFSPFEKLRIAYRPR